MYQEDKNLTVWKEKLDAVMWNTSAIIHFIITANALQIHGKKGDILTHWTLFPHLKPLTQCLKRGKNQVLHKLQSLLKGCQKKSQTTY